MKKIKYIALDMDGTLLSIEQTILPKTKQILLDLQEKGYKVILATGRFLPMVKTYYKELMLDKYGGYLVLSNGAVIYEAKDEKKIFEDMLSVEDTRNIIDFIRNYKIYPYIRKDHKLIYEKETEEIMIEVFRDINIDVEKLEGDIGKTEKILTNNLKDSIDFEVYKIMGIAEKEYIDLIYDELQNALPDNIYVARTSPMMLEFCKKGITKSFGLEKINVKPEELIAFGDSLNDLEMIEYAKYGYAMKNAMKELKDISYDITKYDHNNEGIYYTLKDLGL